MSRMPRPSSAAFAAILLLTACARGPGADEEGSPRVSRPPAGEIAESVEAARGRVTPLSGSALTALRRLLAIAGRQAGEIELGRVDARSGKPEVGLAPVVEIRFDAVAHGADSVSATAAFERLVAALRSADGCIEVEPAASTVERGPAGGEQVRFRGAEARFRLPVEPRVDLAAGRTALQSLVREAAVRADASIGSVDLVPRERELGGGLVDVELAIRPLGKRAFPLAGVIAFCEALESGDPALRVTAIELGPDADARTFECTITRREAQG